MKTIKIILALFGSAGVCATNASAQSYSIDWFTIDGGGGTSSGANYSLSGTVGQPDAGESSGGNFSVQGGFWSFISVIQTVGAPKLAVLQSGNNVVLSWPLAAGFVLEHNNNLSLPNNWSAVAQFAATNNGVVSVTLPVTSGQEFFRLKK